VILEAYFVKKESFFLKKPNVSRETYGENQFKKLFLYLWRFPLDKKIPLHYYKNIMKSAICGHFLKLWI